MVKPNSEQMILDLVILCLLGLLVLSAQPSNMFPHIWRSCPSCLQAAASIAGVTHAVVYTIRSILVALETVARLLAALLGL